MSVYWRPARRLNQLVTIVAPGVIALFIGGTDVANATPIAPADFFVRANTSLYNGNYATDTGALAGPFTRTINPTGSLYTLDGITVNTTGIGDFVSTGHASAAADRSTGQLHAAAAARETLKNRAALSCRLG